MGKHVCPVCEDVYAAPASVAVEQADRSSTADGWGCPACGYIFMGLPDIEKLVRWSVDPYAAVTTYISGQLVGTHDVIRRPYSSVVSGA
jgi:rubredoxin